MTFLMQGMRQQRHLKALFYRQLALMLAAEVTPQEAFATLAQEKAGPKKMREAVTAIEQQLAAGECLGDSMALFPELFPQTLCTVLKQTEIGQEQAAYLYTLADEVEKAAIRRRRFMEAISYPLVISMIAFILINMIFLVVIPAFQDIFTSFGTVLPGPTQWVVRVSQFWQSNMIVVVILCLLLVGSAVASKKVFYTGLGWLPGMRGLLRHHALCQFFRQLATLLHYDVPLSSAISDAVVGVENPVYGQQLMALGEKSQTLSQLKTALTATGLLPAVARQVIGVGMKSQAPATTFTLLADFYEQAVDRMMRRLTVWTESMAIVVLGLIIGYLVIAMYLPIFTMVDLI